MESGTTTTSSAPSSETYKGFGKCDLPVIKVGEAASETRTTAANGDLYEGPVTYRTKSGKFIRTEAVLAFAGLSPVDAEGSPISLSAEQKSAVIVNGCIRRAVFLALKEGLVTRTDIEKGSLDTCRAIARLGIFGTGEVEPRVTLGDVAKATASIHKMMMIISGSKEASKDFELLRYKLTGRTINDSQVANKKAFDSLFKEITALAERTLYWESRHWRQMLDRGLNSYNRRNIGGLIAGKLHKWFSRK